MREKGSVENMKESPLELKGFSFQRPVFIPGNDLRVMKFRQDS